MQQSIVIISKGWVTAHTFYIIALAINALTTTLSKPQDAQPLGLRLGRALERKLAVGRRECHAVALVRRAQDACGLANELGCADKESSIVSTRILGRRTMPICAIVPFLIPHPTWFCG